MPRKRLQVKDKKIQKLIKGNTQKLSRRNFLELIRRSAKTTIHHDTSL